MESFFIGTAKVELDGAIKNCFAGSIRRYLKIFLDTVKADVKGDVEIKNDASKVSSQNNVGISLEKFFSGEEFYGFICKSIGKDLGLGRPDRRASVVLSLRSEIHIHPSTSEPKITVLTTEYGILSTYLATFFPSAR